MDVPIREKRVVNVHPNSLANLKPSTPGCGKRGNGGRPKGSDMGVKLKKMLSTEMDINLIKDEELKLMILMLRNSVHVDAAVKKLKVIDCIIARMIVEAMNGNDKYTKLLFDRRYGTAPLNINVDNTIHGELEQLADEEIEARLEMVRARRREAAMNKEIYDAVVIDDGQK